MMVGKNTASGEALRSFIERVERIREEKKTLNGQEKQIWAEASAAGYTPVIMKTIIKRRAMKPSDVEEVEGLLDTYQHALGMLPEPPLFRAVGLMAVDVNARESVIEALKQLVPAKGDIILNIGSEPVRLERDKNGDVKVTPYAPPSASPKRTASADAAPVRENVPDCDEAEAEALGGQAYHDDQPVIANPFPPGDKRRARFDLGWRKASGGDGMGED